MSTAAQKIRPHYEQLVDDESWQVFTDYERAIMLAFAFNWLMHAEAEGQDLGIETKRLLAMFKAAK